VDEHPGGDAILKDVGGDATKGFFLGQHPDNVFYNVLPEFVIGVIRE